MNDNNLKLRVFTPKGLVFDDEVIEVNISTVNGQQTYLKNHAPLVNGILNDKINIQLKDNTFKEYVCGYGLISVKDNILKIVSSFFIENTDKNIDHILRKYENSSNLLNNEKENYDTLKLKLSIINSLRKMSKKV